MIGDEAFGLMKKTDKRNHMRCGTAKGWKELGFKEPDIFSTQVFIFFINQVAKKKSCGGTKMVGKKVNEMKSEDQP